LRHWAEPDPRTKREWAKVIQQHSPGTKILVIYLRQFGGSIGAADAWLESPAIPAKLAERVAALSTERAKWM